MAIKISGNTVIDDSRNLVANTITATTFTGNAASVTLPDFLQVLAPVNQSPADNAELAIGTTTPTLKLSGFQSTTGSSHANTQFQVSTVSDFASTVVDSFTGANTCLVVPVTLSDDTTHFFRGRYFDNNGCCSSFSTATSFCIIPASTAFIGCALGDSVQGGFYMGTICAAGSCYYLVMAPNASGCACCIWKTTRTDSGVGAELCDGYGNTYDHLANATHPAGNWTATRSIGGFSDWYLPARDELDQLYTNCGSSPAGEGFVSDFYWSSTETTALNACIEDLQNGDILFGNKCSIYPVRAIRRVSF